ncbi:TRAP transporter large permease [Halomonas icarae]|uniref:TRAP transporter large permease protein n=1 Tax=Halomonas icarae TaxID=2691040 RepID=A0A7X4VZ12_9GAMM|nr:TRAP transporter large permease subunit [Halomonas icarae]MDR5901605.1 TRAP transporter large permease subunit [Halomonas icarae]NAW12954.1 TRAP transporter large permease subunit [Halomonas icarae]
MGSIDPILLTLLMFGAMLGLMFVGVPLAWTLMGVGVGFGYWIWGPDSLGIMLPSVFGLMNEFILVALPLFILMGMILERSGIADDLFGMVYKIMGGVRGGLGMGTVVICALIAAMVGITGAATVSLGLIALPAMLKRGYSKQLSAGAVMAGGALGFLIPPSLVMILYAFLTRESVGKLFAAGVMPGLMLAGIYIVYIGIRCYRNPEMGPPIDASERLGTWDKIKALNAMILPGGLIAVVLGTMATGVASPTEASALGASGAMLCALVHGRLNIPMLSGALYSTARIMGMLMWIMIGAVIFSKIYIALGAGQAIVAQVMAAELSPYLVLTVILLSYLVLGMFLDDSAILFITVPLYVPIIKALGFDPIWFATLFVLAMQSAYLTPPFGYNLFYMRSVAPPEVTTGDLYRSVVPFLAMQILGIVLLVLFPQIALWLPGLIFD